MDGKNSLQGIRTGRQSFGNISVSSVWISVRADRLREPPIKKSNSPSVSIFAQDEDDIRTRLSQAYHLGQVCTGGFWVQSREVNWIFMDFQRNLTSLSCFASRNSATNQRSRMMWTASRFTVGPWENAEETDVLLIFWWLWLIYIMYGVTGQTCEEK